MPEQSSEKPLLVHLPKSLRERATELAQQQGISLNYFITRALSERIARAEQGAALDSSLTTGTEPSPQPALPGEAIDLP